MGDSVYEPLISIVIPTRNEEGDIDDTLRACIALAYRLKEIIVVDDSTDGTAACVARYGSAGVRLVKRARNDNGCCGARNLGMSLSKGEIVVLLNADNRPQTDFLTRILGHFRDGADALVVRSEVSNRDTCWSQYLYVLELEARDDLIGMPLWSEGFSVRRKAAEHVGYIPGDFPIAFCRDNALSGRLEAAGHVRHYDPAVILPHVVPSTLRAFWRNRVWRGTMAPYTHYYMRGRRLSWVTAMEFAKCGRTALWMLSIVPGVVRAMRQAKRVGLGRKEIGGLFVAGAVDASAYRVGGLRAVGRIWRARLSKRPTA